MSRPSKGLTQSTFRKFLDNEASAGLVLMGVAVLALIVANSPLAPAYFAVLHLDLGPLSVVDWINDALMALFFLVVGLEIKREMLDGQLASWSRRLLPGGAALGGMLVPALIYFGFNADDPAYAHGWAIPAATDIAFALGVLSLLGPRVPVTLKVFLAALAILDDLGAVLIIAIFYSQGLNLVALGCAGIVFSMLIALNRFRVEWLSLYLALGLALWFLVFLSGVHATIAGVLLAMTIPITLTPGTPEANVGRSPLHRLEQALHRPVSLGIVPLFGFANAGLSLVGLGPETLQDPVTIGVGVGLMAGKFAGVFGAIVLMVKLRWVTLPASASWLQTFGVALLCGIGFTMSLFVSLLAFDDPDIQDKAKLGILFGSTLAGFAGYLVLSFAERRSAKQTNN